MRLPSLSRERKLEAELATSRHSQLLLEQSNAHLQEQIEYLRGQSEVGATERREAQSRERLSLQVQANLAFERHYGVKLYPDAPSYPETAKEPVEQPERTMTQGSEIVRQRLADTFAIMEEKRKKGEWDGPSEEVMRGILQ